MEERYRTCWFYGKPIGCNKGDACPFIHDVHLSQEYNVLIKKKDQKKKVFRRKVKKKEESGMKQLARLSDDPIIFYASVITMIDNDGCLYYHHYQMHYNQSPQNNANPYRWLSILDSLSISIVL